MGTPLEAFVTAVVRGVVDSQDRLDEAGRDSVEAFSENGIPPTVLAWRSVRLGLSVGLALAPKVSADGVGAGWVRPDGGGRFTVALRYLEAAQGGDDPRPAPEVTGG